MCCVGLRRPVPCDGYVKTVLIIDRLTVACVSLPGGAAGEEMMPQGRKLGAGLPRMHTLG